MMDCGHDLARLEKHLVHMLVAVSLGSFDRIEIKYEDVQRTLESGLREGTRVWT